MGHYHLQMNSPSRMTLREVMSKSTQVPPTPAEKKVAKHLVQCLLNKSTEQVMRISSTRGQVGRTSPGYQMNDKYRYIIPC